MTDTNAKYDFIIVGAGTAGATLARELSAEGQQVLLIDRGEHRQLKETLWGIASILNEEPVAGKLKDPRVFAVGGTSAMYLAVVEDLPLDVYSRLGIDLAQAYEEVQRDLPIAELPDDCLSPQSRALCESASALGYDWKKNRMLIDQSRCEDGYSYEAKWKALSYVEDALRQGTTLQSETRVDRVLIENGEAVGVECSTGMSSFFRKKTRFYGGRVILAAGSLVSPLLLRNSGLAEVARNGYYIDPSIALLGRVPGLKGSNSFAGTMGSKLENGTGLLDANLHKFYFRMGMLQLLRPLRMFAYAEHMSIMVKAHDRVSGSLSVEGRFQKDLEPEVFEKLDHGAEVAMGILERAGAKDILRMPVMTGGAFGTLTIGQDVDSDLQTEVRNLYVCDGSLIHADARVTPTVPLICMAKYLKTRLVA